MDQWVGSITPPGCEVKQDSPLTGREGRIILETRISPSRPFFNPREKAEFLHIWIPTSCLESLHADSRISRQGSLSRPPRGIENERKERGERIPLFNNFSTAESSLIMAHHPLASGEREREI